MKLMVETAKHGQTLLLYIRGTLNAQTANELRAQLRMLAPNAGQHRVLLDMQHVPFIDSMGLAALVAGIKHIHQHGGDVVLAGVTRDVMRIFQITQLDHVLQFADSVEL